MVATLNIVEQNNMGKDAQQAMIELQAGDDQVQVWRGWYMQTISMPQPKSIIQKTPSRSFCGGVLFSQEKAFEQFPDAPCLRD